jgi:hypothetical protein
MQHAPVQVADLEAKPIERRIFEGMENMAFSSLLIASAITTDGTKPASIQNGPRRLKRIKELHWQTHAHSSFDPQRIFRPVANPCGR